MESCGAGGHRLVVRTSSAGAPLHSRRKGLPRLHGSQRQRSRPDERLILPLSAYLICFSASIASIRSSRRDRADDIAAPLRRDREGMPVEF